MIEKHIRVEAEYYADGFRYPVVMSVPESLKKFSDLQRRQYTTELIVDWLNNSKHRSSREDGKWIPGPSARGSTGVEKGGVDIITCKYV